MNHAIITFKTKNSASLSRTADKKSTSINSWDRNCQQTVCLRCFHHFLTLLCLGTHFNVCSVFGYLILFLYLEMVLLSDCILFNVALIFKGECSIPFSSISILLSVVFYVVRRTRGKFWPLQSSRGLSCCGVNDLATKSSGSFSFFWQQIGEWHTCSTLNKRC